VAEARDSAKREGEEAVQAATKTGIAVLLPLQHTATHCNTEEAVEAGTKTGINKVEEVLMATRCVGQWHIAAPRHIQDMLHSRCGT